MIIELQLMPNTNLFYLKKVREELNGFNIIEEKYIDEDFSYVKIDVVDIERLVIVSFLCGEHCEFDKWQGKENKIDLWCPIPNNMIELVKKNADSLNIEIGERLRVDNNFVLINLKINSFYHLFALGAVCHVDTIKIPDIQKDIDNLFNNN